MNCPQDCEDGPPGECGNGKCEPPGENPMNCPDDCDGPQPGECGNGECQPGENPMNCPEDCQGGPDNLPTCETSDDCSGDQTCVDLMGWTAICLSVCESDGDCGAGKCQEIGAFGYTLANVCDCTSDVDCGEGLTCCEIPYVKQTTCLTQCFQGGGGF